MPFEEGASGGGGGSGLSKPIGPLPAWGWAVVVVGGIGGYLLIKNIMGGSSSSLTATPDSTAGTASAADLSNLQQTLEQQIQDASTQYQTNLTTATNQLSTQEQADIAALTGQLGTLGTQLTAAQTQEGTDVTGLNAALTKVQQTFTDALNASNSQDQGALASLTTQLNTEMSTLNQQLNALGASQGSQNAATIAEIQRIEDAMNYAARSGSNVNTVITPGPGF